MSGAEVSAAAAELLAALERPRRRPLPRLAAPLAEADYVLVDTPVGQVAAWRWGRGDAVLLVHGWEDDNSLWTPLIEALAWRGRAVVALDLPGHGYSPAERARLPDCAAALAAVAAACGPVTAGVGHSFGCPALMLAMSEGLKLQRLALIAAPVSQAEQWARAAARRGVPQAVMEAAVAQYEQAVGSQLGAFDLRYLVHQVEAEALFVHSADDEDCPMEPALAVAAAWRGAQRVIVDGFGHRPVAQAPDVVAAVAGFVDPIDLEMD